ncbi:uncharacterized protein PAC_12137 [Phialocephala subalpina]|uniref:Uncharacterized protein n=1 Tax=Phialocephala subalpina TaxID=576137 RepID=A0A1L7XB23_9HELO|nr:uncharacterized protein PAC_12137 [Phialocephala subalpina]
MDSAFPPPPDTQWWKERIPFIGIMNPFPELHYLVPVREVIPETYEMSYFPRPYKAYPPPSNKHYTLTSEGKNPALLRRTILRKPMEHIPENSGGLLDVQRSQEQPKDTTDMKKNIYSTLRGERLADRIDWSRYNNNNEDTDVFGGPIYTAEEARADYKKMINEGAVLEFCKVCKRTHIPHGPPITLADRDTCGAYLPDWFPKERFEKPWDTYRETMSQIADLEDYKNDSKLVWDRHNHGADMKWAPLGGQNGGYWKCRQGSDAIEAELRCAICHRRRTPQEYEQEQQATRQRLMAKLQRLRDWVAHPTKIAADRDKGIALAMLRDQFHFGMTMLNPPPKEPVPPLRIPYDSDDGEGEGKWKMGPYGGQIPWKPKNYRNKAKMIVDESMRGSESPELRPTELHHDMSTLDLNALADERALGIYDGSNAGQSGGAGLSGNNLL